MTFRFLPPAEAELLEAISYYSDLRSELGVSFEEAVSESVRAAAAHPGTRSFAFEQHTTLAGDSFSV